MKIKVINSKKNIKPIIPLTVRRVESSIWRTLGFYKHHYLTASLNKSCKTLLFEWEGEPVAIVCLLNTPRRGLPHDISLSRIVILPQYQGIGLSEKIASFCGGIVKSLGEDYRLTIKFAHTKFGSALENSGRWEGTQFDGQERVKAHVEWDTKYKSHMLRKSFCKKYVGKTIYGYEDILAPIKEMRNKKNENYISKQK